MNASFCGGYLLLLFESTLDSFLAVSRAFALQKSVSLLVTCNLDKSLRTWLDCSHILQAWLKFLRLRRNRGYSISF